MSPGAAILAAALAGCGPRPAEPGPVCETGWICPIMGTGELGFDGDGKPPLETRLASPTAVREAPDGTVVVVDYSNMRLRYVDDGGRVRTLVGSGIHAFSEIGASALDSPLENPVDARWGPDGLLYIQPQHESRVVRVEADGTLGLVAGTGLIDDSGSGVPGEAAGMGYGSGIAFDADGSLVLSDRTFHLVRRVGPDGLLDNVLGVGHSGACEDGDGPTVPLNGPGRLVVDADAGLAYVPDAGNHAVLELDLDTLAVRVVAGTGAPGRGPDGALATASPLHEPEVVELLPSGGLLVGELGTDLLRAVSADGRLRAVAGVGAGCAPDPDPTRGAPPQEFCMTDPSGLAWTQDGDLLIAERGGHRVLRWFGAADAL